MSDPVRITLEGFEDFRGDFDTGIYLVKPQIRIVDGSSIENVIEDYCIDASLSDIDDSWDEDEEVTKRIRDCFYKVRKKKVTPNFKYFRAVVEVYPYSDDMKEIYTIIESEGF